ncbi:hypothetical protein ACP4OV_029058 [Aristida adscensionis]
MFVLLVEAWDRDVETGGFTSTVVVARLDVPYRGGGGGGGGGGGIDEVLINRKYLAAAAADGRLVAVLKGTRDVVTNVDGYGGYGRRTRRHFFELGCSTRRAGGGRRQRTSSATPRCSSA